MSSYENYDHTSRNYDATRSAVGVPIILGCLAMAPVRLDEIVLVDAGCGTGNYAAALLEHVGRVEAVDLSAGMIERARAKITGDRVRFHQAPISALPLADASADAVMVNQVLHHLSDDASAGFSRHRAVLAELVRVLRPGGVVVINTSSRAQLDRGFWYLDLIPAAAERIRHKFAPLPALETLLAEVGFTRGGRFVPTDEPLQPLDPRGPLRPAWREGDSVWSLVADDELAAALERVRRMDADGSLDEWAARRDASRLVCGQITFVAAFRP